MSSISINANLPSHNGHTSLLRTHEAEDAQVHQSYKGRQANQQDGDVTRLEMAEKLNMNGASLRVARRDAEEVVSLMQTAEGALGEVGSLLKRMQELADRSANDELEPGERGKLNREYQAAMRTIDRIAKVTKFGGARILDGSLDPENPSQPGSPLIIQTGLNETGNQISLIIKGVRPDDLGGTQSPLAASSIDNDTVAERALSVLDTALQEVDDNRLGIDSVRKMMVETIGNLMVAEENVNAARATIRDVDNARNSARQAKDLIVGRPSVAVLAQANAIPHMAIQLLDR